MSPRDPFDDEEEDSSNLDSFELLDEDLDVEEDLGKIPEGLDAPDDGIPVLDDVVEPPEELTEELYGADYRDLEEDMRLREAEPAADILRQPIGEDVSQATADRETTDAVREAVKQRLSAEMDEVIAGVADSAVRRVVEELQQTIQSQLRESLSRRVAELIDEELQRRFPGSD